MIGDVNEHPPFLAKHEYDAVEGIETTVEVLIEDLDEDQSATMHIARVIAILANGTHHQLPLQTLADNPLWPFEHSKGSHFIKVTTALDYEQVHEYRIEVLLADVDNLTATDEIRIRVENRNDNPPIFLQNPYRVRLSQDLTISTHIATIVAEDADGETQFHYSLDLAPEWASVPLRVNAATGKITLTKELQKLSAVFLYEHPGLYKPIVNPEPGKNSYFRVRLVAEDSAGHLGYTDLEVS